MSPGKLALVLVGTSAGAEDLKYGFKAALAVSRLRFGVSDPGERQGARGDQCCVLRVSGKLGYGS